MLYYSIAKDALNTLIFSGWKNRFHSSSPLSANYFFDAKDERNESSDLAGDYVADLLKQTIYVYFVSLLCM